MNTNNIKQFAKQARLILLEGVRNRLTYWGFEEDGSNSQQLETTHGGYIFRGNIFTDTTVPAKWNKLKKRLDSKQAVQDVIEAAAYTWFNRLMAIKILETKGYIGEQIAYAKGMRTPMIVQNAKRGANALTKPNDQELLKDYLLNDQEEQAFGLLITNLCNWNKVLHDIFGRIDDYTEILLPQNLLQADGLLDLINSDAIALEDYKEVELIGWLYQFYISDKKDEVFKGFKKNIKARAEDIPAATQIFTPKWIVKYMVENTVGKVYLDYEPSSTLKTEMKYLVGDAERSRSAPIISDITELTLIDPACGSGHILVTGFELLFKMYREEGYTAKQAVESILKNNLYGLDIDDRAMQLARFAVLLKAAEYDSSILEKGLMPHIYSFPEAATFANEELQLFLGQENHKFIAEFKDAINLLEQGKNIGSALKLKLSPNAFNAAQKQFNLWLQKEQKLQLDINEIAVWNSLKPIVEVLLLMTNKYKAVVANPPYMGQKSMNADLKNYVNKEYPATKSDLMTVFMEVIPNLTLDNYRFSLINLPSWLFLSSFEKIRTEYISNYKIDSLLHMGRGIFGIDFGSVVFAIQKINPDNATGNYFRLHKRNFQHIHYEDIEKLFLYSNGEVDYKYDFADYRGDEGITEIPKEGSNSGLKLFYPNIPQSNFSKIPGSPFTYWISEKVIKVFSENDKLVSFADIKKGLSTGDNTRFLRDWFEISLNKFSLFSHKSKWFPYNKGGGFRKWYGLRESVINWENKGCELKEFKGSVLRNKDYYFKEGVTWSALSSRGFAVRYTPDDSLFDGGGSCGFGTNITNELLLGILNSNYSQFILAAIIPTLNFEIGTISSIPVYIDKVNNRIESVVTKNIEMARKDWDSRETSWDFQQSPFLLIKSNFLGESYQNWQEEVTQDFFQLHTNEEELNRIFIEIYGLQEELTPDVALKDITILQEELDRNKLETLESEFRSKGKDAIELPIKKDVVLSQFVSYAIGVFMGRYRLDKPGLNIAHPNPTEEELAAYKYNGHTVEIDDDAILPLMGDDCAFPDDALVRTKDLLLAIWGEDTLTENINFLQDALGMDLHKWLGEKFWGYHTKMYKKKPIYWLFSSNIKKPQNAAFKVLVYMHRMDKYTVQKIQRNYLHPHQEYIKREIARLQENEANLNKDELRQLEKFQNWELECRDYNEVLKELANQQIEFDLDDGVSVNYAKFEGALAKI